MADPAPWEMDWTPAATPGGLAPRRTMVVKPVNNRDEARKDAADRRAAEDQALQERNARLAEERAARERAEWNATHNPDGSLKPKPSDAPAVDPATKAALENLKLDGMLDAITRARRLIKGGTSTGIVGQVLSGFWGTDANDLKGQLTTVGGNVTLDKLTALKQASSTGASGLGALTGREADMLRDSLASLGREQSAEQLLASLGIVERSIRTLQAVQAGKDPEQDSVRREFGLPVKSTTTGGVTPSGGDGLRPTNDPALAGMMDRVTSMIQAGASEREVRDYMNSVGPGLGDRAENIAENIAAVRANPDFRVGVGNVFQKPEEATSILDKASGVVNQARNALAQSEIGTGIVGAADMLSGGLLDNLSNNPALTRAGMAGIQKENPKSFLAGQVIGAAAPGVGVELGAAKLLGGRGLASTMAGDLLPGMMYGAGSSDDGSRLGGAALGGLAGVIGGAAGRSVGRLVGGVTDPAVGYLDRAGVRLTPGQLFGGAAKRLEDRAAGFPLIGDMIQAQRARGIEDFNRGAFKEALQPIGQSGVSQVGEAGVDQAQDLVSKAYADALGGKVVRIDPQFGTDLGAAVNMAQAVPTVGDELVTGIGAIVPPNFTPTGELTGEGMQATIRGIRDFSGGYRTNPQFGRPQGIRESLDSTEDAVTGLFERQAPEVMPAFNQANDAYRNLSTVEDAVLAAANKGGKFMPSQLNRAAVVNAKRFGGKRAAARGERPLFELGRAGQEVLPSEIPESGTAGRLFLPGALAGSGVLGGAGGYASAGAGENAGEEAGSGAATGLALGTALLSPYLARGLIQSAVAKPRPVLLQSVGEFLGRSRLPGSLAIPLLASPE